MGADFTNPQWPRRIMFYRALKGDSVPGLKGVVDYVKNKEVISGDKDIDNGSSHELTTLLPRSSVATTPGDHDHASATKEFSNEVIKFLEKKITETDRNQFFSLSIPKTKVKN